MPFTLETYEGSFISEFSRLQDAIGYWLLEGQVDDFVEHDDGQYEPVSDAARRDGYQFYFNGEGRVMPGPDPAAFTAPTTGNYDVFATTQRLLQRDGIELRRRAPARRHEPVVEDLEEGVW